MDTPSEPRYRKKQDLLLLLCFLLYTGACIGKYSYPANTVMFISTYGVSKAEAGLVATMFFVSYGCGQIVNGLLCNRYDLKKVLPICLSVAAAVNITIFFDIPFSVIKYIWLVNGIAESFLWPCVILLISRYFSDDRLGRAVVVMSATYGIGTCCAYGFSAFFVQFFNFKFMFLTGGIILLAISAAFYLLYDRATDMPRAVSDKNKVPEKATEASAGADHGKTTDKRSGSGSGGAKVPLGALFLCELIFLAVFAAANNLIKDGLSTWIPSILKESFGLPESLSILLTVCLAIVGAFGSVVVTTLSKKIHGFLSLSALFFGISAVLIALTLFLLSTDLWGVIIAVFALINLFMHALNNVVTSLAPMTLRRKINAGLLSGIMNGCCYVGSALSAYGLGAFADKNGWNGVFILFIGVCAVMVVMAVAFDLTARISGKRNS